MTANNNRGHLGCIFSSACGRFGADTRFAMDEKDNLAIFYLLKEK